MRPSKLRLLSARRLRALLGVAFVLATLSTLPVLQATLQATPAHASISSLSGCPDAPITIVNNASGRLMVAPCVRHLAGSYSPQTTFQCFTSGTWNPQGCNVGADEELTFADGEFGLVDHVSGLGCCGYPYKDTFYLEGTRQPCPQYSTNAWTNLHSGVAVRFWNGNLFYSTNGAGSGLVAVSPSC